MAWAAGTAEGFAELSITAQDVVGQEFKAQYIVQTTGNDTTALTNTIVQNFLTDWEAVSNCAIVKAALRSISLTPYTNSTPKTAGATVWPSVVNEALLAFERANPLIPSKTIKRVVAIPAPVAGTVVGTGSAIGEINVQPSDLTVAGYPRLLGFLNNFLAFQNAGNDLYYGGLTFHIEDSGVAGLPKEVEPTE